MLAYICSPYRGDVERNTEEARKYSRFAVDQSYIPIAPHLLFPQFMDEETERDKALAMGQELMSKCDEVWIFGSVITEGMQGEINTARSRGIPIQYFDDDYKEAKYASYTN